MTRSLLFLLLAAPVFAGPRVDPHGDTLPDAALVRFGTVRHRIGALIELRSWALSPDGKTFAVEDRRGITLWDVESGKPVKRLSVTDWRGDFPEYDLQFSADGKSIIRMSGRVVSAIDTATGKERWVHDFKKLGMARQISVLSGPDRVVLSHEDLQKAFFLDADTGRLLKTVDTEAPIWNLSPRGNYFLGWSQGVPAVPHLVDAKTGKVHVRFPDARGTAVADCVLSPDDRRLYVGRDNGRLQTFDAATGKQLEDLARPIGLDTRGYGTKLSLSADGNTAYLSVRGKPTRRRDLKAGKWLEPLPASFGGPILTLPGGKQVLQVGQDGVLRRYDLTTLKHLPQTDGFEGNLFAYPSPDGRLVATASEDSSGSRIDLFNREGKLQRSIHMEEWARPHWSPDSRILACVGNNTVVICDATTGKAMRTLAAPNEKDEFSDVHFTSNRDALVAILNNGQDVAFYDLRTGERVSNTPTGVYAGVTMSPDGRTLLFDSVERGVALFDVERKQFRTGWIDAPPEAQRTSLGHGMISPDGSYVLSWDASRKMPEVPTPVAVVRDAETLERKRAFEVAATGLYEFALSPDGQWLAIGDSLGDLCLWDVATGQKLGTWQGHRDRITKVGYMGQGRVLTSSDDLTALIWELRPKEKPKGPAWDAISGADALAAYQAVWAIADDPKGPELLRSKIPPAKPAAAERIKQWLADLEADKFTVREAATKELQAFGRLVEPELRAARAKVKNEEVRSRLDALLAKISRERSGSEIVNARAVAAMELSGSDAAKKLLAEWAGGAPGARLTVDAKAALARVNPTK